MIQLSESAVSEVLRLKARRKNSNLFLRLGIQFTGCLGLSYVIAFDESIHSHDQVHTLNGVQVVIDAASSNYLNGLVVDYSEDLMGGGFRFHNPNAAQNCGCGISFTTDSAL